MTRRVRNPLVLAAALALVPVSALAVMFGPARHGASLPRTGVATPTPTAPTTRITATPAPSLAPLPSLVVADRFDLGAARAYGRIDIVGDDYRHDISIGSYAMAATPPSMPSSLPVWKLRGFATTVDTAALAVRLGIQAPSTPLSPGSSPNGRIAVAEGSVSAGSGIESTILNTGSQVGDDKAAVAAVARVLSDLGISPQNADPTVSAMGDVRTPTWEVRFTRRHINGIPVGFGLLDQGVADVQITQFGNIARLSVDEPAVDGGALYSLRPWREAWAEVSRGHWFSECCYVNTGGGGRADPLAFRADRVSLVYEAVGFPATYLVPMYVFTDSHNDDAALTVPALRLGDLSEPGGFRLVEPGAA
jgi:hypothetical protein